MHRGDLLSVWGVQIIARNPAGLDYGSTVTIRIYQLKALRYNEGHLLIVPVVNMCNLFLIFVNISLSACT